MQEKFSNILLTNNMLWKVCHNHKTCVGSDVLNILKNIQGTLDFDISKKGKYYVAVGYNSFEYFIYIMLASRLGLKIILCDPKMLKTLLDHYHLNYTAVLSSHQLDTRGIPLLKIDINRSPSNTKKSSFFSKTQSEFIFFTSGTTDLPKLVVYKEKTLLGNARLVGHYLNIQKHDKCLCFFPTHYMYGFSTLMSTLLYSGEVILERSTITAQEIWLYLIRGDIKFLPLIRPFIEKLKPLIDAQEDVYFKDMIILNASDRVYQYNVKDALCIGGTFWNNFGQTESGPRIFALKINHNNMNTPGFYSRSGIVALGKPVDPAIHVSILNENGDECGVSEVGELNYQTPYCMEGYLDKQGNLFSKKYIASGDFVYKNEIGNVCWVGRKNEIIKINGIYTNIGLLHRYFDGIDEIKKSYFIFNDKEGLSVFWVRSKPCSDNEVENKIISLYKQQFPSYPRINRLIPVNEIPKTLSGKIKYSSLQNINVEINDA